MAQPQRNDINVLYAELGHPLEVIAHATGRVMDLNLTGALKPVKDVPWERSKKWGKQKSCQALQNFGREAVL